jgi:hypothetical protein
VNSADRAVDYDLYLQRGFNHTIWRATDQGLRLTDDRIAWSSDGQAGEARLADIAEVNLKGGHTTVPGLFVCGIRFTNGLGFRVSNGVPGGSPDPARAGPYGDFVRQLHARLSPNQRAAVRFTTGTTGWRAEAMPWALPLIVGFAGLMFLGLLAVVVTTGALRPLLLLITGGILAVRLGKGFAATKPGSYDPYAIPDELLPPTAPGLPPPPPPIASPPPQPAAPPSSRTSPPARPAQARPPQPLSWQPRRAMWTLAIMVILTSAVGIGGFFGISQTDTMLQSGQAQRAFAAIKQRAGPRMQVHAVEITPRALTVWAFDPDLAPWQEIPATSWRPARKEYPPAGQESWNVSHWRVFWLDWYRVAGPELGSIGEHRGPFFDLQPGDIPDLPSLARKALASLGRADGTVAHIRLDEAESSDQPGGAGHRRWTVQIGWPQGQASVVLGRDGRPIVPSPAAPPAPVVAALPAPDLVAPPSMSANDALSNADAARGRNDYAEAARWYRIAAAQGDAKGQFNLGIAYDKGDGVTRDRAEALSWYRKAADQGLAQAQNLVAEAYSEGNGVAQDYAAAVEWFRKAADQDYAPAQLHLGTMYATGRGVPQDYVQALHWYRLAAEQGKPAAEYDVGLIYARGLGVPADRAEARRWMEKAAAGGHAMAQRWLDAN